MESDSLWSLADVVLFYQNGHLSKYTEGVADIQNDAIMM